MRKENKKHIPITVRQLEAIIRLSEALAKMWLSNNVEKADVEEANWLFEVSTIDSLKTDLPISYDPNKSKTLIEIEDYIWKLLPIG